jgi:hypothetical protein
MKRSHWLMRAGTGVILALLVWGSGLPLAAAAPGAAPPARSPGLLISEVYAPVGSTADAQWFELFNMRPAAAGAYPLNGLILGTGVMSVTLQTTRVLTGGTYLLFAFNPDRVRADRRLPATRPIVEVPEPLKGQGLNPAADLLALYTPDGSMVIDAVNWGPPNDSWPNFSAVAQEPVNLPRLETPAYSWGRTWPPGAPTDTDSGDGADWTLHKTLSPGGGVPPTPQNSEFFLGRFTDWVGVLSGILLWAAFIIVGIIAYRFERLRETRTYWQLLLLAPSGILFYTYIVAQGFASGRAALTDDEKWLGFPILAASAVACLLAVAVFQNVARSLLEGE